MGSKAPARREDSEESQEDSRERRTNRDNDDEGRERERVHGHHGRPARGEMGHDRIEAARSDLAGHPVRVASDVRMTTQRSEQEVPCDLDQRPQRSQRPHRGTQFGGRGEDERECHDEDSGDDRDGLATSPDVTEDGERCGQSA